MLLLLPTTTTTTYNSFKVHEDWKPARIDNDIALVFLDEDFEMNDNVQAVTRAGSAAATGDDVTATGWGKTCDGVSARMRLFTTYVDLV